MSGSDLTHLTFVCANCSTVNQLTADALPDSHGVNCPRCKAPLGRWGDLNGGGARRDIADL
jgi:phage FluMu protein Com